MTEEKQEPKEIPWWLRKPNLETPKEELIEQIKAMQQAHRGIPKWLVFKQVIALGFIVINVAFMYVSIGDRAGGYIAAYMVPLTLLLIDYFLVIRELKLIAAGTKA